MTTWVDELITKWTREGVKLNRGASIKLIGITEKIIGFSFPDDFKTFYLQIDGFRDLDWQEHMFYFWPLERIIEEYNDSRDNNFIGFCDFLLASHFIGFKKSDGGIFKMYSIMKQAEDELVAQSFQEVVSLINSSSDQVY